MMKDNKIDKLFKAKTSEGPFTFKEAHWAAAEKMLDAEAAGAASTGRGFNLGLMAGLVLVATTLTASLIWLSPSQESTDNATNDQNLTETPAIETNSIELNPETKNEPQNATTYSEPINDQGHSTGDKTIEEKNPSIEQPAPVASASPEAKQESESTVQANAVASSQTSSTNETAQPQPNLKDIASGAHQSEAEASETEVSKGFAEKTMTTPGSNEATNTEQASANASLTQTSKQNTDNGANKAELSAAEESSTMPRKSLNGNTNQQASDNPMMNGTATSTSKKQPATNAHVPAQQNDVVENRMKIAHDLAEPTEPAQATSSKNAGDKMDAATATESGEETSNEDIEPFKWNDNFTYSVGGEFGYFFNQRQLSASPKYEQFRSQHETQNGSLTGGLSFQLGYRNWVLSTGIYQYVVREDVTYPSSVPTTVGVDESYWSTFQVWSHTIDSTWVINGINQGTWHVDTNWSVHEDSVFMEQWDSTIVQKENPKIAKNNGIKTIAYAEVPVLFGRSFKMNKLVLDVQAGMSFGFLTRIEGAQYTNQRITNLATENQIDQFNQVVYSGMLRVGLRYGLSQNLEVGLYPSLRYTLKSVLKPTFGDQKYVGYGLQFGLYYRL